MVEYADFDGTLSVEQAVIGSLAIDSACAGEVFQRLEPSDFFISQYRTLFTAARDVWLAGRPLDAVSMADQAGIAVYRDTIVDAMRATPTAANVVEYCDRVKTRSQIRAMQEIGEALAQIRDPEEGRQLLAKAEGLLLDGKSKEKTYTQYLHALLDRLESQNKPEYLDWGLPKLNHKARISPGTFCVLGAEQSTGKTALALQFAYHFAAAGHRVLFLSNETTWENVGDRVAANATGIRLEAIKDLELQEAEIRSLVNEGAHSTHMGYFGIVQSGGWPLEKIRAKILADRAEIVFIDYLQQIPWGRNASRPEVVTNVSIGLHEMAQTLGVTVVALSQVTPPDPDRNGKRRHLRMGDLRESRQLCQDGELIMMLDWFDTVEKDDMRVLIVDKNKDGACGTFYLDFHPEIMRFTQAGDPPPPSDEDAPPPRRKYKKRQDRRARYRDEDEDENQEAMELPD